MMRTDLTAGSANEFAFFTPNPTHQEPRQQWRDSAGANAADTGTVLGIHYTNVPVWLRLVRIGNIFHGYVARDTGGGTHGPWIAMTTNDTGHTTALPSIVYVGLAVTAHNNGQVANVTFDNVTVTGTSALNVLRLTDGAANEAASAFATSRVGVANFTTNFTFQFHGGSNPSADGMAFVLQAVSPSALGPGGGGLGYGPDNPQAGNAGGIHNSVAIKFDLYDNAGEGNDSTGIFINGDSPTVPQPGNPNEQSIDLTGSGIDLHSQHVFAVTLTYDGTTLTETITDTATQASFTTAYTVDIVGAIGSDVAYAGFTAGTGGLTTIADVDTWSYQFTEPSFGPAPHGGGSGSGGLSVVPGTLNPGSVPLVGGPSQASVASTPAVGPSGENHQRRVADLLSSYTGSPPAFSQGLYEPFVPGLRGDLATDLLGQPLDPNALDVVFSGK
jgi:hypothetical protein